MRISLRNMMSLLFAVALLPLAALPTDAAAETAEPLYMQDYFDGTALDLTQYEGKAVYLNYFTEWCPYCMAEMPDIKKVFDLYDPDSLVIILIHPWDGEDADNSASVVAKYGLEGITVIEDEDFALVSAISVPGYPTSIFVDQEGYLYYAIASKLDQETITAVLDGMGVPLREGVSASVAAPAQVRESSVDTTTQASPNH